MITDYIPLKILLNYSVFMGSGQSASGNKKSGGSTSGKNVKTGDAGIALSVMALMAAGGASLVLSRRKKDSN